MGYHVARGFREIVAPRQTMSKAQWTTGSNVHAQPQVVVNRILREYGNPPDKEEKATQSVLKEAELLSEMWSKGS
jgi:type I restriction enzyme R subunit